jgi:NAD(P)-dependent dehydrogenase (short-subunit alcohol dehydrogenase family)
MAERVIAVTGSASGIGAATAARLRAGGDHVVGVDLAGSDVDADLSTEAGRTAAADGVLRLADGRLGGIVACAGIADGDPRRIVGVNYFGTVRLVEQLLPALAAGGGGAVAVVASYALTRRPPAVVVDACLEGDEEAAQAAGTSVSAKPTYAATKLALARWVRAVAPDWVRQGIRVNAVAPGLVHTAITAARLADPVQATLMRERLPMPIGVEAEPDDIASVLAFLVTPGSRFVVGQLLFVDGGADALVRPDLLETAYPAGDQD